MSSFHVNAYSYCLTQFLLYGSQYCYYALAIFIPTQAHLLLHLLLTLLLLIIVLTTLLDLLILVIIFPLSITAYEVLLNKLDILEAELFEFDILGFTETWLNPTVQSDDLVFRTFHKPERKD